MTAFESTAIEFPPLSGSYWPPGGWYWLIIVWAPEPPTPQLEPAYHRSPCPLERINSSGRRGSPILLCSCRAHFGPRPCCSSQSCCARAPRRRRRPVILGPHLGNAGEITFRYVGMDHFDATTTLDRPEAKYQRGVQIATTEMSRSP